MRRALSLLTLLLCASVTAHGTPGDAPLSRAGLIQDFLNQRVGTVPLSEATGELREFTLEVHRIRAEISPGVTVEQWAFGFPGQTPSVPGPELRVHVGDRVRITLVNAHDQPHTLHLHGITSLAQEMDGVPHTSQEILPGQRYTYEFVATEAGTNAYHCHFQTSVHLDMGMYGALIVEPRAGTPVPWSAEHTLILDEWDSQQTPLTPKTEPHPDLFLVNGHTYPLIPDVVVPEGEVHLLRLINLGAQPHSLHLHGMSFLVIAKDGHDLPAPYQADTLPILPGERYDLLVKGRDGSFPMHDHNTPQNVNGGVYPGGMHFMLRGGPALKADGSPAPEDHGDHDMPMPAPTVVLPGATMPGHDMSAMPMSAPNTIEVSNFVFAPKELRVRAGQSVTWHNADPVPHTVVIRVNGQDETHELAPGASFSLTLPAGRFEYHCLPHPFMKGAVVVDE